MMCDGHVLHADQTELDTRNDKPRTEIVVMDSRPEVDGDMVEGTVLAIEIRDANIEISFDLEDSRAFIEACQEILNRYDK